MRSSSALPPSAGSSGCKGSSSSSLESSYPGRDKNKLMHISEMHCKHEKYAQYDKYDRYVQYDKYDEYETTTLAFSANGPSISLLSSSRFIAIYSMLFLGYRTTIGAVRANSQSTMAVVIRNMQLTCPIWKKKRASSTQFYLFCHAKRRRLFIGVFDFLECLMQDLMSVSLPSTITRNSGKRNVFEKSKK